MTKSIYWLPLLLIGCASVGVEKIGDNLYSVSEKSQPTQAAAEHIPDPALDDIKDAAKKQCDQTKQKVKVISFDQPQDPTLRQGMITMKFSCTNPE
mgnify:CR=1 FL=1